MSIGAGSCWIKKHGNVQPRLTVEDDTDQGRLRLRVTDNDGAAGFKTGQVVTMAAETLTFYYAAASTRNEARDA